jgi:hypothetical protein
MGTLMSFTYQTQKKAHLSFWLGLSRATDSLVYELSWNAQLWQPVNAGA